MQHLNPPSSASHLPEFSATIPSPRQPIQRQYINRIGAPTEMFGLHRSHESIGGIFTQEGSITTAHRKPSCTTLPYFHSDIPHIIDPPTHIQFSRICSKRQLTSVLICFFFSQAPHLIFERTCYSTQMPHLANPLQRVVPVPTHLDPRTRPANRTHTLVVPSHP